ncbi:MAG: WG repeat-containing protein [Bacteroidales bacterium]|nr:WG repeat-containing protein [Bacteroidales bacterium]
MKIIKQIIFLALWIGFSIDSSSQSLEPFFSEKYELYGYKDTHSGRLVLPLQYTVAGQFQDGFARVRKYGESNQYFIDQQGNRLATANYSVVNDFSDGMAMVKRNDSVGFINKTGKEIIPLYPDIFNVKDYHDGYSLSKIKWYYVFNNKSGKLTFPTFYSYKYYGYSNAHSFSEGLAAVKDEKGWGYIDVTGKLVIPDTIMTEYISDFKEGLALIYSGFNNSSCYLINRRGRK